MEAKLANYRQAPRKVRLLADLVRGKKYNEAITILTHTSKRGAEPVLKLLKSAAANATHNHGAELANLIVKDIQVDKGIVLKRMMPRARGTSSRINKRTSHIYVKLGDTVSKMESVVEVKTAEVKKTAKAPKVAKAAPKTKKTK